MISVCVVGISGSRKSVIEEGTADFNEPTKTKLSPEGEDLFWHF